MKPFKRFSLPTAVMSVPIKEIKIDNETKSVYQRA